MLQRTPPGDGATIIKPIFHYPLALERQDFGEQVLAFGEIVRPYGQPKLKRVILKTGEKVEIGDNDLDQEIVRVDAVGARVEYTYDANGNQTSIKNPEGHVMSMTYDTFGNKTSVTDFKGPNRPFKQKIVRSSVDGRRKALKIEQQKVNSYASKMKRAGLQRPKWQPPGNQLPKHQIK